MTVERSALLADLEHFDARGVAELIMAGFSPEAARAAFLKASLAGPPRGAGGSPLVGSARARATSSHHTCTL